MAQSSGLLQITSAKNILQLLAFGLAINLVSAHEEDPNKLADADLAGTCASCIAARKNYCLNGNGDAKNAWNQRYGQCLPSRDYCIESKRPKVTYYQDIMYFGGCDYFGVYHY